MSHFNPILAGEAALSRGDEGAGMLRDEAEMLQRVVHDFGAPMQLIRDLGRFRGNLETLTAEWERLATEAKKGPAGKWE